MSGPAAVPPGRHRLSQGIAAVVGGHVLVAILSAAPVLVVLSQWRSLDREDLPYVVALFLVWYLLLVPRFYSRWEVWGRPGKPPRVVRTFLRIPIAWRTLHPTTTTRIREVHTSQKRDVMLEIHPLHRFPPRMYLPLLGQRDASVDGMRPSALRLIADALDDAGTLEAPETAARLRHQADALDAGTPPADSPLMATTASATLFRSKDPARPDSDTRA